MRPPPAKQGMHATRRRAARRMGPPIRENTQGMLDQITLDCAHHLAKNSITAAEAAHMTRTLGCACTLWWARKGRTSLQPLRVRQYYHHSTKLNPSLVACLEYWFAETQKPQPRPLLTSTAGLPLHITITDGEGSGWIGLLYLRPRDPTWSPQAARVRLPEAWRHTIAEGEHHGHA